jgi:hypothetical protein
MHAAGMLVGGGTADDAPSVNKLTALNADFVDSDRPGVAIPARDAARGVR